MWSSLKVLKVEKGKVAEEWSVLLSAFRSDVFPAQTVWDYKLENCVSQSVACGLPASESPEVLIKLDDPHVSEEGQRPLSSAGPPGV